MPRLTKDQWSAARIEWESDKSVNDSMLAEKYGITQQAVTKKRMADGWQRAGVMQNIAQRAQIQADESEIAQSSSTTNAATKVVQHNQKADVVNVAVEIRAKLLETHREDWKEHRKQFTISEIANDFTLGKSAKITAEMLKIRQEGERKAYGLDEQQTQESKSAEPMQIVIKRATKKDD